MLCTQYWKSAESIEFDLLTRVLITISSHTATMWFGWKVLLSFFFKFPVNCARSLRNVVQISSMNCNENVFNEFIERCWYFDIVSTSNMVELICMTSFCSYDFSLIRRVRNLQIKKPSTHKKPYQYWKFRVARLTKNTLIHWRKIVICLLI